MSEQSFPWPVATFYNVLFVLIGGSLGLLLQSVLTDEIQEMVLQAVGLGTILIGIKMALRLPNGYMLIFIFSMIIGGVFGEIIHLDDFLNGLSTQLKDIAGSEDSQFTEGLITAFLLFCVGSMTIVGAIEEGLKGDRNLLYVKTTLDGFTSIALAATYGVGVLFSVIPLLLVQGGLTLLARSLRSFFNEEVLDLISAVGGILIIGISIKLLKLGNINLENLLPAIVVSVILAKLYQRYNTSRATN